MTETGQEIRAQELSQPCPFPFSFSELSEYAETQRSPHKILYLTGQRSIDVKTSLHVLNPLKWHMDNLNAVRGVVYRAGQRSPANSKINAYSFNTQRVRQLKDNLPVIKAWQRRAEKAAKQKEKERQERIAAKYNRRYAMMRIRAGAANLTDIQEMVKLLPKQQQDNIKGQFEAAFKEILNGQMQGSEAQPEEAKPTQ